VDRHFLALTIVQLMPDIHHPIIITLLSEHFLKNE
jgi:hypothetical protein